LELLQVHAYEDRLQVTLNEDPSVHTPAPVTAETSRTTAIAGSAGSADVGVVGGGTMGVGIAHAFLAAGCQVKLIEADRERAMAAERQVAASIERSSAKGGVPEDVGEALRRLVVDTELSVLRDCQLVIEAVPEDLRLKLDVIPRIEASVPPTAVLATNTSSMSIAQLAQALKVPHRFAGLHFFNPVPVSVLVEVVAGPESDAPTIAACQSWVELIGKTAVVVHDAPGFASSRLGVLLAVEAIRMLEEGVASAEDIDKAMTLGYRHPMGPLRLTDLIGLDVRLAIAEYLTSNLGPRFAPPGLLRDMVVAGKLGRKSGEGFFRYQHLPNNGI
jgi:3-hydroxybutyryl-CoA dehydrogenase